MDNRPVRTPQIANELSPAQSKTILAILNSVASPELQLLCQQNGIDPTELVASTSKALSPTTNAQGATITPQSREAPTLNEKRPADDEEDLEMECEFDVNPDTVDEKMEEYIAAGFQQRDDTDPATLLKRLREWAKEKNNEHCEHRKQAKALRKTFNSKFAKKK